MDGFGCSISPRTRNPARDTSDATSSAVTASPSTVSTLSGLAVSTRQDLMAGSASRYGVTAATQLPQLRFVRNCFVVLMANRHTSQCRQRRRRPLSLRFLRGLRLGLQLFDLGEGLVGV